MSVYLAKTPDEFKEKVLEFGATSISYENGPHKSYVTLARSTPQTIERVFNDCINSVSASSVRSGSTTRIYVPLVFEAIKEGIVIISGKWSIVSFSA